MQLGPDTAKEVSILKKKELEFLRGTCNLGLKNFSLRYCPLSVSTLRRKTQASFW